MAPASPRRSRAFYEAGARFFFAATPDEGIAVRAALPEDAHIFILDGLCSRARHHSMSASG